jgi:hypothetical protein
LKRRTKILKEHEFTRTEEHGRKISEEQEVSGHGFSRAEECDNIDTGL